MTRAFLLALSLVAYDSARASSASLNGSFREIPLTDTSGSVRHLSEWDEKECLVLAFLGLDCPLSKLYAERLSALAHEFEPHVSFLGIVANRSDDLESTRVWWERHGMNFPVLKDQGAALADLIGAKINPEVFLLDEKRQVRYRGRIDDQYVPGLSKNEPTREDLRESIEDVLAGRRVEIPETKPIGCFIQRPIETAATGDRTYFGSVRDIFERRCVSCHQADGKAPFPLINYEQAVTWSDTIRLVIEERRMPPWYADAKHGRFANRAAITEDERNAVLEWLDEGMPPGDQTEGDGRETVSSIKDGWAIPEPNLVLRMPEPYTVPATGVIEYQHFLLQHRFKEDAWVQAAEIRPGNQQVVHHCVVFLVPPGATGPASSGELGSICLVVDSIPQLDLPEGMAKRIPAGWGLMFVMHYTAIGTEQTDQTELGLLLVDRDSVRQEVATHLMVASDLVIPPGVNDYRYEMSRKFEHDVRLLSLYPHMHFRGKSFTYIARYPDGREETLLSLPTWDFNWQHNYVLAEPKWLPAGTTLRAIAHYDNSTGNPANPDATATVRIGPQTWDEMFNAYYDFVLADQDLQNPTWRDRIARVSRSVVTPPYSNIAIAGFLAFALILGRCGKRIPKPDV